MNEVSAQRVLDAPMDENEARAATVRGYLIELLASLWDQRDEFDGKRPFGYSDWEWEVYSALVRAGLLDGQRDSDGAVTVVDEAAADLLVADAIRSLGNEGARA